jgi:GT2 family glycosyltransferase
MQESDATTKPVASIGKQPKRGYFIGSVAQQIDARLLKSTWRAAPIARHCFRSTLQLLSFLKSPRRLYGFVLRQYPRAFYRRWIARFETLTPDLKAAMDADLLAWPSQPLISIILFNPDAEPKWLNEAIRSVTSQIYPNWELCLCSDPSTLSEIRDRGLAADRRIRTCVHAASGDGSINQNNVLGLARGDYLAFLGSADLLSEDALFWVAREIAHHPEVDLLFSDEDMADPEGVRLDPLFKSAWNQALMLSQNAFGQLGVYRREIVEKAGGLRSGYGAAQDHDLVLRCAERTIVENIRHIPRVLYHRRKLSSGKDEKPSNTSLASKGARQAISDHLQRVGIRASVIEAVAGNCQVQYEVPQPTPFVSIIVPSTLSNAVAANCLTSVLTKSTYREFELLILVRSNSMSRATNTSDFARILADPRVRIIQYEDTKFNFSRICNLGERSARGSVLCFLNDDVEVITHDWLERLVSRVVLDGVGAVGPMLYYPNDVIQHAGVLLGVGSVAAHVFAGRPRGYRGYFSRACVEQDYSCVTGACVVIKREVFEAAGGFDESLPVAFNDVDLCLKIRRNGARIVWTPLVEMYHHESLTFGPHDSPQRLRQFVHDVEAMRLRWGDVIDSDPSYNPNLELAGSQMFLLALSPRLPPPERILVGRESISRTSQLT